MGDYKIVMKKIGSEGHEKNSTQEKIPARVALVAQRTAARVKPRVF